MKKKGFTLVELLAVIVILAIIALIATPMILNVIDNAKKGAAEESTLGYIEGIEKYIVLNEMTKEKDLNLVKNSGYTVEDIKDYIEIKGDKPTEGWICIGDKKEVTTAQLKINNYVVKYEDNKATVVDEEIGNMDCTQSINTTICTNIDGNGLEVGSEYSCMLGSETESRTFYILNKDDSSSVKLIMDKNFEDNTVPTTMAWCDQAGSNPNDNSCAADGITPYINYIQNLWTNVGVGLPTYDDIYAVNNSTTLTSTPWLYGNLSTSSVLGYWTSTPAYDSSSVWNIFYNGMLGYNLKNVRGSSDGGIRPVITVSKDKIS